MTRICDAKALVRKHMRSFDGAPDDALIKHGCQGLGDDFKWRSMHPFYERTGIEAVVTEFWQPLRQSLRHLQRREDIFFGGENDVDQGASVWTCSMGHFVGLFDVDWLGIPRTGRIAHLRYAEFMRVEDEKIVESALFFDLIGLMHQAGVYPLPPMTGSYFIYPGPQTHDGILDTPQDEAETRETIDLMNRMIADLDSINHLTGSKCPPELLARTWREDMIWYGPCGIGASYTIARYQEQHQHPFRLNLADKTYNGHVARFTEGTYGGFFGWANLSNRNIGGFLGLPEATKSSEMRVVDVYRRDGDKLAENWVFIDLPYYLKQQGLDVLERLAQLRGHEL
ncbi:MAG: nuclear transport factor 2 family protein [Henriciella sp.]|nr:nuclear transport factor 2 family protein [Henriciella sp.]MBO6695696.1 nuclear transport factor 2 family protein [Henriciella sp.]